MTCHHTRYSHLAKRAAPAVNILNFVLNQSVKGIYRKLKNTGTRGQLYLNQ